MHAGSGEFIFWAHFWLRKISMNKFPLDNWKQLITMKACLLHVMFTKSHGVSINNIGVLRVILSWILRDGDVIKADLLSLISKHAYLMWVCFVLAVEMFFANGLPCYGWFNYYLWRLVEWLQLVIHVANYSIIYLDSSDVYVWINSPNIKFYN